MAQVNDFLNSAAAWARDFWAGRPEDILLLGFIVGFFAVFASWRNKRLSDLGGFLLALRNISSAVIIFICIGMIFYIAVTISPAGSVYYIIALLSGMIVCRIFLLLLSFLFFFGDIAGTALNLVSGPTGVFAVRLFLKNELLPEAENLLGQFLKILN